jgi:hypothetical protein
MTLHPESQQAFPSDIHFDPELTKHTSSSMDLSSMVAVEIALAKMLATRTAKCVKVRTRTNTGWSVFSQLSYSINQRAQTNVKATHI